MKKKFLSLLTVMLAVVLMIPVGVMAVEGPDYSDFQIWANRAEVTETLEIFTESTAKNTIALSVPSKYRNVAWHSSDSTIAEVNQQTGLVTAKKPGKVTISVINADTFTSEQVIKDDCTITVTKRALVDDGTPTMKRAPSKLSYISGQKFDPTGLQVEYTFNDGKATITDFQLKEDKGLVAGQTSVELTAKSVNIDLTFTVDNTVLTPKKIDVKEKAVKSIVLLESKKEYTEDDVVSGVKIGVTYNDDDYLEVTNGFDITIDGEDFNNKPLTVAQNNKKVVVSYSGESVEFFINVAAKPVETEPPTTQAPSQQPTVSTRHTVRLGGTITTSTYKVGEKFNATGLSFNVYDTDTGALLTTYNHAIDEYTFTSSDAGKTSITLTLRYVYNTVQRSASVAISNLTITSNIDSTKIKEISGIRLDEDKYAVGHKFTLADIKELTVKFDGSSRSTDIDDDDFSDYAFISDVTLEVLTSSGSRKSSTYYRSTIREDDVQDDDGDKFVQMRVYYKDEDDDDRYYSFKVDIGEEDISYIYDDELIAIYDDLEEALEYCNEQDDDVDTDDFDIDDVRDSEYILLKLGKSFKLSSSFDDFSPDRNIVIDLNGHDLTLYSDTFVIDRADEDYTIIVKNSSSTKATLTYDDKDITITLEKGDKVEFEYDKALPGFYTVTVTAGEGGTVSTDPRLESGKVAVGMGSDLEITITPKDGYAIDNVRVGTKSVVSDKDNYKLSYNGTATYTLKAVKEDKTVTATFKKEKEEWDNPFTDVRDSASYYSAVEFVHTNGLFQGTTTTKFSPNTTMTRAMFVTVLGRLADVDVSDYRRSSFTDVPLNSTTSWYAPYVEWAVDYGIVQGYGNGTFGPNNEITHQQMYVMMYRYAMFVENQQINLRGVNLTASDRSSVADWAVDAAKFAQQNDFLVLSGNRIDPTGDALRWELATLLESFCDNVLGWANDEK